MLKPGTSVEVVAYLLPDVDLVLVMTVNPGFGGQKFIPQSLEKIAALRRRIDAVSESQNGRPIDLEVDGGIAADTAGAAIKAGADVLVAGTASFQGGSVRYAENIARLRQ